MKGGQDTHICVQEHNNRRHCVVRDSPLLILVADLSVQGLDCRTSMLMESGPNFRVMQVVFPRGQAQ